MHSDRSLCALPFSTQPPLSRQPLAKPAGPLRWRGGSDIHRAEGSGGAFPFFSSFQSVPGLVLGMNRQVTHTFTGVSHAHTHLHA